MEEIKEKIKNISLFKRFKDDEKSIKEIVKLITVKDFPKESHIIREGDRGDEMYILNKGGVRIEKTTMDDDTYTVVKLEDFMNVFFGEMALIDDDVRSASVLADTDCECFVIKKSDFQKLAD
ncbi:MAG: cyclic nucleotide-binding domain-containing protein, partial [bacterium]